MPEGTLRDKIISDSMYNAAKLDRQKLFVAFIYKLALRELWLACRLILL